MRLGRWYFNVGGDAVGAVIEDGIFGAVVEEACKGHALLLARRQVHLVEGEGRVRKQYVERGGERR